MNSRTQGRKYIHGFSKSEFPRLIEQAAALAPAVYDRLDFEGLDTLLEIGCGVGAQTKHIVENWPKLRVSSIDRNSSHLALAARYLEAEIASEQVYLYQCDAASLPFPPNMFDAARTIWVLEHIVAPESILAEAKRILKPGGQLILTEVDNETLEFFPRNEVIKGWWAKFNSFQRKGGADPFIGKRLGTLAQVAGFSNISQEVLPIVSSTREPGRRHFLLRYLRDLLLSGAENLKAAGYVSYEDEENLLNEFQLLEPRTDVNFQYLSIRVLATKPY